MNYKKIGVFGGSFDPVHYGHVYLAKEAVTALSLDKLFVIPTKLQPFKLDKVPASGQDRCNMLELAFSEFKDEIPYEISDLELKKEGISYTIETLNAIKDRYPTAEIFFIQGTDTFIQIKKWKSSEELLKNFSFAIGLRPGYRNEELFDCIAEIKRDYGTNVVLLNNKQINISATDIRLSGSRNFNGKFVSEKVERYIRDNGLYK